MSRKHEEPTVSRHIEVFESDWAFLQAHFGRGSGARIGVSRAIRDLIRKGIRDYEARLVRKLDALAPPSPPALPALERFFRPSDALPQPNRPDGGYEDKEGGLEITPAAMKQLRRT